MIGTEFPEGDMGADSQVLGELAACSKCIFSQCGKAMLCRILLTIPTECSWSWSMMKVSTRCGQLLLMSHQGGTSLSVRVPDRNAWTTSKLIGWTCDLEALWRQWAVDYPLHLIVACLCKGVRNLAGTLYSF